MIAGGQRRRRRQLRVAVNATVLQRRLDKLAAAAGLQLDPHAIDAQLVARMRSISEEAAPRQTGNLR